MSDSIVKPLLTQVKATNDQYDQVVQGLATGKPESKQLLKSLIRETKKLFANFQEKQATLKASLKQSPGFAPNVGVMVAMLKFYIQEIIAIVQLISQLMALVAKIIGLKTVIDWIVKDLQTAQKWLQKQVVLAERAANRVRQKVQKNLEWIKTAITIKINEIYSKAQLTYYTKQLNSAKASQVASNNTALAQTVNTPSTVGVSTNLLSGSTLATTSLRVTGTTTKASDSIYSGGVSDTLFTPNTNNTTLPSTQSAVVTQKIVALLQDKVDSLTKEVASYPAQRQAIDDDKKLWNTKWAKESAADQAALASDVAKIGANFNV